LSWQRVKGHDGLIAAITRAVKRGRLAHAYLFVGPAGVGKRLFARELAKAVLCQSPPAGRFDACDCCQSCLLVEAGTHPDLFTVGRSEGEHELPIDAIVQLCADLAMKPARGGRKIAILDDADDLNEHSANSFLKTLEEPPPGSMLILIGTAADRQLPTIRSRCQVVAFAPLRGPLVRDLLAADGDADPALTERLAQLADGSPGLARELAHPAPWAFRRKLFESLAGPKPDTASLADDWRVLVDDAGKDTAAQRRRAALVLRLVIDGLRQAVNREVEGPARGTDPGDAQLLSKLSQKFGPDDLLRRLERCLEADAQIERRVQLVLVLEGLLDALSQS
jgi:DNA polymerase III subunit delta'